MIVEVEFGVAPAHMSCMFLYSSAALGLETE